MLRAMEEEEEEDAVARAFAPAVACTDIFFYLSVMKRVKILSENFCDFLRKKL
jgi:hypothetical protein